MSNVPSILRRIVDFKKEEIKDLPADFPDGPERPSFYEALLTEKKAGRLSVIAECKKGSPSAGIIEAEYNPAAVAAAYNQGGATCISVLTDNEFFFGSLDHLTAVREACNLPLLRKDFIIDERQIKQAKSVGASAILLIAAILDTDRLIELHTLANDIGLDVLVEVHDTTEMDKALQIPGIKILGVNNRNLHDFTEDLGTTAELRRYYDGHKSDGVEEVIFISESAVKTPEDIQTIAPFADGVLVGTSLMRGDSISMLADFKAAFSQSRTA